MNNSLITTVKLCTACIFTVNFSAPAAQRKSQVKWLTPVKPGKNACPASALFHCSLVWSDTADADHKATPPPPMKNAPPPPVIRPPNAAADHQFVGAQLYRERLRHLTTCVKNLHQHHYKMFGKITNVVDLFYF